MKICFSILICILSLTNSFGQSDLQLLKDKFHHGYGVELDYSLYPFNVINSRAEGYNYWESVNLHLSYFGRINILEINKNNALSISIIPSLGIGFHKNIGYSYIVGRINTYGLGSLNMSTTLTYRRGAGATNESKKENGFLIGFGKETRLLPLFFIKKSPKLFI